LCCQQCLTMLVSLRNTNATVPVGAILPMGQYSIAVNATQEPSKLMQVGLPCSGRQETRDEESVPPFPEHEEDPICKHLQELWLSLYFVYTNMSK
jgi:hypothetical protein